MGRTRVRRRRLVALAIVLGAHRRPLRAGGPRRERRRAPAAQGRPGRTWSGRATRSGRSPRASSPSTDPRARGRRHQRGQRRGPGGPGPRAAALDPGRRLTDRPMGLTTQHLRVPCPRPPHLVATPDMRCPWCGADDDRVVDSRPADGGSAIRRRRQCAACGRRYTTYERIEDVGLVVRKRDDRGTRSTGRRSRPASARPPRTGRSPSPGRGARGPGRGAAPAQGPRGDLAAGRHRGPRRSCGSSTRSRTCASRASTRTSRRSPTSSGSSARSSSASRPSAASATPALSQSRERSQKVARNGFPPAVHWRSTGVRGTVPQPEQDSREPQDVVVEVGPRPHM